MAALKTESITSIYNIREKPVRKNEKKAFV
jgi:hypothetical protein